MGTADDHIRVSEPVKREIERRRREGESYNDVLARTFSVDREERDLLAGFGRWSDEQADRVREQRHKGKEKRTRRMRRLDDDGDE